ncbi:MAG: hypothetical protein KAV83_04795 [Desulfobacterales bacterium]|nr:hypothetical protein [Desulfobacterales bacterium]
MWCSISEGVLGVLKVVWVSLWFFVATYLLSFVPIPVATTCAAWDGWVELGA